MYAKLTIPERLKDLRVVDKHLTLEQLVHVFLTDNVHFREIEFAFSLTQEFGFDERGSGKAPDRKSTRLNSSHKVQSRMPSSA